MAHHDPGVDAVLSGSVVENHCAKAYSGSQGDGVANTGDFVTEIGVPRVAHSAIAPRDTNRSVQPQGDDYRRKSSTAEVVAELILRTIGAPGFEPGTFWSQSKVSRSRGATKCSIHAVFWASES
jgi:hypothetical protein